MQLGIIAWISEDEFKKAKERNLEFVELDVNERDQEFLEHLEDTKAYSQKYEMPIAAIGRWGKDKISQEGILKEELQVEKKLIDAAKELSCGIYMTGCNYVEGLSYYQNCTFAMEYLKELIAYGKERGVKIATYNCRWNNFIHSPKAWSIIHGELKDLYIKFDTSHSIYDGGDYLAETRDWAERFIHVHIKGALLIGGERFDDPPAGLDQTDWRSFLAILYAKGYDGGLSIEPHSPYWKGELGERGVEHTIHYMRQLML